MPTTPLTTNSLLTADKISALAVALLSRSIVLPRTVSIIGGAEYAGPSGGTVSMRVRQPRTSRIQATPGTVITFDDADEVAIPVVVKHHYSAVVVSDEDLSLNLEDFGAQILAPSVAAVAKGAENELAAKMNALPLSFGGQLANDGSDIESAILYARETLGRNEVPLGGRWFAVSPEVATYMLALDKFSAVDQSGSPSALRDAVLGRIYGFNVVESAALSEGTAIAYHSSAFGMGLRAPVRPNGTAHSATASVDGIALRIVQQFDASRLADIVAVSTFAGAATVFEDGDTATEAKRFIKFGQPTSS